MGLAFWRSVTKNSLTRSQYIKHCPCNNTIHTPTLSFAFKVMHQYFAESTTKPQLLEETVYVVRARPCVYCVLYSNDDGITREPMMGSILLTKILVSAWGLSGTWSKWSLKGHFVLWRTWLSRDKKKMIISLKWVWHHFLFPYTTRLSLPLTLGENTSGWLCPRERDTFTVLAT